MTGLIRRAFEIIFDFKKDVTDLSDRLEKSERTERRLVAEATDLHVEIGRLRSEIKRLETANDGLSKALNERISKPPPMS